MNDIPAARLRSAREKAGYSSAAQAAQAFGWQESGYRHHENGVRPFSMQHARKYARAFRVNALWLLNLDRLEVAPANAGRERVVEVIGTVGAGLWRESFEWPEEERYDIVVSPSPFPEARRFGLRVDGFSMDVQYPPGTVLDCVSSFDINVQPESGDMVIVERQREDGLRETTVKEYFCDADGRHWLLPRSTRPEFQAPIEVGTPDYDHDGDDQVQVIAFVIGHYQPGGSRLASLVARRKAAR